MENIKLMASNSDEKRFIWTTHPGYTHIKRLLMIENRPLTPEQDDGKYYPRQGFRIRVDSGGCKGFQYCFTLDDAENCTDIILVAPGIEVIVDDISLEIINGTLLDYVDELIGSSFKMTNPNATASCGCNNSFTI